MEASDASIRKGSRPSDGRGEFTGYLGEKISMLAQHATSRSGAMEKVGIRDKRAIIESEHARRLKYMRFQLGVMLQENPRD